MGGLPERTDSENDTLQEERDVMSQIEELYSKLNLTRLKSVILNWVNKNKHPVSKVTLYQNSESKPRYVLVAELPPFPEGKTKERQTFRQNKRKENPNFSITEEEQYPPGLRYNDDEKDALEVYESTQGDCAHLWDWLPQIYEGEPPEECWNEWMWFNVLPREELDDRFVREDTRYVLYGDIDPISETTTNNKKTWSINPNMPQLNVSDYITKCKAEGVCINLIAFQLYDDSYDYKLTHLEIARTLGLDCDLNKEQVRAIKQRGKRAVDRGRAISEKKLEKI